MYRVTDHIDWLVNAALSIRIVIKYFGASAPIIIWIGLLTGCAGEKIAFDVRHAPEMRLAGIQTIEIYGFESSQYCQTSILGPQMDFLAVSDSSLSFAPNLRDFPKFLRNKLRERRYSITESDNPNARLSGHVVCNMELQSTVFGRKNGEGKAVRSYQVERRVSITANFSVVSKSGEVFESTVSASRSESGSGDSVSAAASNLQSISLFVIDGPMDEAADKLLQKISPHVTRESRHLETGDSTLVKDGNALASNGAWIEAAELWKQASRLTNNADRSASLHNLAIYDEIQGKLYDAQEKLEKAYSLSQESKYERAIFRIRTRIDDEKWMRDQKR